MPWLEMTLPVVVSVIRDGGLWVGGGFIVGSEGVLTVLSETNTQLMKNKYKIMIISKYVNMALFWCLF